MSGLEDFDPDVWREVRLGEEWAMTFRRFERSAFRLETLQHYSSPVENQALEKFRQGHCPSEEWIGDWCSLVSEKAEEGRSMRRVHVVDLPFSDYLRFETECAYVHTSRAGEEIFFLDRTKIAAEVRGLFAEDYWLFDRTAVMVQDYSERGEMLRARLCSNPEVVEHYIRSETTALELAVPFRIFYESRTGIRLT